jgi:glutamate dehydrogenase/leucine dehydrogenase
VFYTVRSACEHLKIPVKGAKVVVQGFGNAGSVAAHLLDSHQALVIAASDSRASIYNKNGLDIPKLIMHKEKTGQVLGFPGAEEIRSQELLALKCDILIPAALENAIDGDNASRVKAKIVGEAANGPVMPEGDRVLEEKGIFLIPDILCNAGGVTVSYFEWVQDEQHLFWEAQDVYNRLERVMHSAFAEVLKIKVENKVSMRTAANMLGIGRVAEATRLRGLYP